MVDVGIFSSVKDGLTNRMKTRVVESMVRGEGQGERRGKGNINY